MRSLILTLQSLDTVDGEEGFCHVGTSARASFEEAFSDAAVQLVTDLFTTYGSIMPEVFEGLHQLSDPDADEREYTRLDFSTPEENFRLSYEERR